MPPVNAAQRIALRTLAELFRLQLSSKGQPPVLVLRKRRLTAPGVLPTGAAEVALARLLAASPTLRSKAEAKTLCERLLRPLGLLPAPQRHTCQGASNAAAETAAPPLPDEPQPTTQPKVVAAKWFIDRCAAAAPHA